MSDNAKAHMALAFDKYIRKCAKNKAIDIHRKFNVLRSNEIPISSLSILELSELKYYDTYSPEEEYFEPGGKTVVINDKKLANALKSITPQMREIVLLSCCLDMSDQDISNILKMPRRTIAFKRKAGLERIKHILELTK